MEVRGSGFVSRIKRGLQSTDNREHCSRRSAAHQDLPDQARIQALVGKGPLGACPTWGDRSEDVGERGHFDPNSRRIVGSM